jgi:hypothetical protein
MHVLKSIDVRCRHRKGSTACWSKRLSFYLLSRSGSLLRRKWDNWRSSKRLVLRRPRTGSVSIRTVASTNSCRGSIQLPPPSETWPENTAYAVGLSPIVAWSFGQFATAGSSGLAGWARLAEQPASCSSAHRLRLSPSFGVERRPLRRCATHFPVSNIEPRYAG